jgi:uncharacterized protein
MKRESRLRALYDVNVLIALFDPQHLHHRRATEWHGEHSAQGWATCPITENGLLRIVSQPKYTNPVTVETLRQLLADAKGSERHTFWLDSLSLADEGVLDPNVPLSPAMLTDVYLLALAVKNKGHLVTLDTKISYRAVVGARDDHLLFL